MRQEDNRQIAERHLRELRLTREEAKAEVHRLASKIIDAQKKFKEADRLLRGAANKYKEILGGS